MHTFQTRLVSGGKPPYSSWTFVVIPPELATRWGSGHKAVRGTIAGQPFRGTASKGEGVLRVPVPGDLREKAGVRCGETVEVVLELDPDPGSVALPDELQAVLSADRELVSLFDELPPAHRRAWAAYVSEAKRPETRARRAGRASDGIRARAFPR